MPPNCQKYPACNDFVTPSGKIKYLSRRGTRGPREHSRSEGFALVLALSLMAFVLLLLLSMSTLVQVENQGATMQKEQLEAEQAAILGLNIAIGKLQEVTGPDQRITAAADLLSDTTNLYTGGLSLPAGQNTWTGVWKSDVRAVSAGTSSYDPLNPDIRSFVGWLVSSVNDTTGEFELPTSLAYVEDNLLTTSNAVINLASDSANNPYMLVEKVQIGSASDAAGHFAFSVEDESLKADLAWSELPSSSLGVDRYQASRLTASPGPDYGALNGTAVGPFQSVTYPLTSDSGYLLSQGLLKLSNLADATVGMADTDTALDWLQDQRSHVTWGSRGVMADVKWGGLRRDLSLAFEMDGEVDVTVSEQPTKFNQQVGEFVGGSDRYAAPEATPGMGGLAARHLYRDFQASGSLFSNAFATADGVIRGPTWWALRDFANIYKRLSLNGSIYSLDARAYYPNRSSGATVISNLYPPGASAGMWDWEFTNANPSSNYIYRPATLNFSPVYLGMTCLVGTKVVGGRLALTIDPIFHFWNPYNIDLNFDSIALTMQSYTLPGRVTFWTKKEGEAEVRAEAIDLSRFIRDGNNITTATSFFLEDPNGPISMKAGEVMVFSSELISMSASKINGTATPGYFVGGYDNTGLTITNFDGAGQIDLSGADQVGFLFSKGAAGGSNRFRANTSLPPVGATESSVYANPGEAMQGYTLNLAPWDKGYEEYLNSFASQSSTASDLKSVTSNAGDNANVFVSNLGTKRFFGLFSVLTKPAHFSASPIDGSTVPSNPFEVFSRFNPLYLNSNEDAWHAVPPNHLFTMVSSAEPDDLLNNYGMNLSTSDRNAFWGGGYDSVAGSTSVPMLGLHTAPLFSIASFSNANLSTVAGEPMRAVGSSWSSPYFEPTAPYGYIHWHHSNRNHTPADGGDISWLANDALFDRYYLSGLAPEYSINASGYTATGNLNETIANFFSDDFMSANANPLLRPYLPNGKTANAVIAELSADDGYMKTAAYSLISGQFNVNSTSVSAWEAYLRANRDLALTYAQGSVDDSPSSDTPFPKYDRPSNPTPPTGLNTKSDWAGVARLTDTQISTLASNIVDQVKLRGPFMSISDFVNHRLGTLNNLTSYTGAIQAALDTATSSGVINASSQAALGSTVPDYNYTFFQGPPPSTTSTTTGISTDINQADILIPLAPRLSARSDTFRIRAYGDAISGVGDEIKARAVCEAVLQRLPEYVDSSDEPWDEATTPLNPGVSSLSAVNQQFGRKFKVVGFRWLSEDEI